MLAAGLTLNFTDEKEKDPATGKAWKESWCYAHGIADYVAEVAGEDSLTPVYSCESEEQLLLHVARAAVGV